MFPSQGGIREGFYRKKLSSATCRDRTLTKGSQNSQNKSGQKPNENRTKQSKEEDLDKNNREARKLRAKAKAPVRKLKNRAEKTDGGNK
jgi:hypothetical protein